MTQESEVLSTNRAKIEKGSPHLLHHPLPHRTLINQLSVEVEGLYIIKEYN